MFIQTISSNTMFTPKTYTCRRDRLKQQLRTIIVSPDIAGSSIEDFGIALFLGHDESPINFPDNCYPFRQESSFLYFFGHNLPGLTGVVDIDDGIDYMFGNDAGIDELIWTGYQPSIKELGDKVGISRTGSMAELESFLQKACSKRRRIHLLPPYRPATKLKVIKYFGIDFFKAVDMQPSIELIKAVIAQREIKTDEEVVQIEEAVNMSVDMHIATIEMVKPGMAEHDVLKNILGFGAMAFTPIATIRGDTLHNHFYGNRLNNGDIFLLDAGVENSMHYASDLSSTFPVDSKFTTIQKDIYSVALDAHEAAVASLAPGVPFKDVHLKACKKITAGLKAIGLMRGDVDEAVALGAHALFFPCGTGHMMGLDVHDMEDIGEIYVGYDGEPKSTQFGIKSLRLAKLLKAGFVLTIEPGIYFIPALIDKWRAENRFENFINYEKLEPYRTFGGIRNEENYIITKTGARLLGKPKPKNITEIEELRG